MTRVKPIKTFSIVINNLALITEISGNIPEFLNTDYNNTDYNNINYSVNDFLQCNFKENCLKNFESTSSFILFLNVKIDNQDTNFISDNGLLVLYLQVNKFNDGYKINIINWLNWINYLTSSLESSYQFMKDFNNNIDKQYFVSISDALCYKAFFPLISYVPKKYLLGISQVSIYEIMRVFIKQRDPLQKFNKDFARNVYSRIRTNMRKTYKLDYYEPIDIIKDKDLLNISYNENIYIPDTLLKKNLIFNIENDILLDYFLNQVN